MIKLAAKKKVDKGDDNLKEKPEVKKEVSFFLALSRSISARRFGEPGHFPAAKLTDSYRGPSMSTEG